MIYNYFGLIKMYLNVWNGKSWGHTTAPKFPTTSAISMDNEEENY